VEHKHLGHVQLKDPDRGEFSAVICTFDRVDADNDVVRRTAFDDSADCIVSSYGHTSWNGTLPVGKARIRTTSTEAIADGQFFLKSTGGRDTHEVVKSLSENGLGSWSWGFDVLAYADGEHEGKCVRFLNKVRLHEVSPVLVGASVGTRTLSVKSVPDVAVDPQDEFIREYTRYVHAELDRVVAEELADIHDRLELQEEMRRIARTHFGDSYV
jgi:phage head maturation protease